MHDRQSSQLRPVTGGLRRSEVVVLGNDLQSRTRPGSRSKLRQDIENRICHRKKKI